MKTLQKEMGARLRQVRESLLYAEIKVSAGEFGKMLGFSVDKIQNYELGKSGIPNSLLVELYKRGINPVYILTGEGSPFTDNEAGKKLSAGKAPMGKRGDVQKLLKFESDAWSDSDLLKIIQAAAGDMSKRLGRTEDKEE